MRDETLTSLDLLYRARNSRRIFGRKLQVGVKWECELRRVPYTIVTSCAAPHTARLYINTARAAKTNHTHASVHCNLKSV